MQLRQPLRRPPLRYISVLVHLQVCTWVDCLHLSFLSSRSCSLMCTSIDCYGLFLIILPPVLHLNSLQNRPERTPHRWRCSRQPNMQTDVNCHSHPHYLSPSISCLLDHFIAVCVHLISPFTPLLSLFYSIRTSWMSTLTQLQFSRPVHQLHRSQALRHTR